MMRIPRKAKPKKSVKVSSLSNPSQSAMGSRDAKVERILYLQRTIGNQAVIQMMREDTTQSIDSSSEGIQRDTSDEGKSGKKTLTKKAQKHSDKISELKTAIKDNDIEVAASKLLYLEDNASYLFTDLPMKKLIIRAFYKGKAKTMSQKTDYLRMIPILSSNRRKFKAMVKKYGDRPGAGYETAYQVRAIKAGKGTGHQIAERLRQEFSGS